MIKTIILNGTIYQGFEEKLTDSVGNIKWNIPTDIEEFRKIVINTINWKIGQNISKATGNYTKLSASNSKAIIIVLKLLNTLSPDTSKLDSLENDAYNKMITLMNNGYGDSELLNNSLDAVLNGVTKGQDLISKAVKATTIYELIDILNEKNDKEIK